MTSTTDGKPAQPFQIGDKLKLLSSGLTAKVEGDRQVQQRVTLTTEDVLTVIGRRDTRITPSKKEIPPPTADETSYKVYAVRRVPERYDAGKIMKVKHIDLSNDTSRKENGNPSSFPLKVGDKAYLRVPTPIYPKGTEVSVEGLASTAGSKGNPFGKVTSATPLKNIVYDGQAFLVKISDVHYIPDTYINHDQFRKV